MTQPSSPVPWRITGDRLRVTEAYIPTADPDHYLTIMRRLAEGPTAEERKRYGRELARSEARRRQALAAHLARHATVCGVHRDHRILSALLGAHGPRIVEVDSKQYAECHGCPSYWEDDPYGESGDVHHEWPCPTWTTIADGTEAQS
jgi:hypothetical protein